VLLYVILFVGNFWETDAQIQTLNDRPRLEINDENVGKLKDAVKYLKK
jgi:hypothetical protein